LTIISGHTDSETFAAIADAGFRPQFLQPGEYGPYEAFIRRSEALREIARHDQDIVMVDRGYLLSRTQSRMLERIARGMGATILGSPWHGVKPQIFPVNPGPGIGNWAAQVLLVGAGPAQGGMPPFWPYISSRPDGPAAWLTEQLEMAGVLEEDLYWVNASTSVGGELVAEDPKVLLSRPWEAVFALGEDAFRWAEAAGFENITLAHYPTWWWGTHPGKDYPAIKAIREAVK
jgi:hypothetical protein